MRARAAPARQKPKKAGTSPALPVLCRRCFRAVKLLTLCGQLLEERRSFLVLNLYSMGLSALLARTAVRQLFGECAGEQFGELYVTDSFGKALPLGVYYRLWRD